MQTRRGIHPIVIEEIFKKKKYVKPIIKKEDIMTFPKEIIAGANKQVVCRQCSGCHGCR